MLSTNTYAAAPSSLILPSKIAEQRARVGRRPKAMDFFAGGGGMSLGTIQAGIEVVAAVKWDVPAAITYALNGAAFARVIGLAMASGVSRTWKGYWQRHEA